MHRNFYPRHSLKTRVTLFTLVIFVISIWSLAFYASYMLREDMQRLLGEQQRSTVSYVAAQVNQEMDYRLRALELTAGAIDPPLLNSPAALQKFVENRLAIKILFNAGIFITRLDGSAIAEYPRIGRVGLNYMDRDHIAAALKEGRTTLGKPVIGKQVMTPSFAMTVPIRDARGNVIGALAGVTDLAKPSFLDAIGESRYGQSGGYLVADPEHKLFVTATDKSRVMQAFPAPGINPVFDQRTAGFDGPAVVVNSVGEEVLSAAARVPAAGWFIVAALPTQEAFVPIHAMQRRLLLATIFLTLLAAALTWFMLGRQLAPMLSAVKTLADLSHSENPTSSLPIAKRDEIGNLIGGFNRLLETLRQREEALQNTERELVNLNAVLEGKVATRTASLAATVRDLTAEIAERKRVEKALQTTNEELETFSYSVAHDLRAPLRGIAGFARLIEEDYAENFGADGRDALHRMQAAAQKMGELIDDLLNLSRLTHLQMNVETVDLSALARAIMDRFKAGEPGRDVRFEVPPLLEVRGDKRLLAALLENLLGNAWKFTGKRADARIELGVTTHDGKSACYVRDNGAGFDMAHAANLFRPFHRLHAAGEFPGTGIGLATVQRIVQSHGGRVWAEAAVGAGATFYFMLWA